MKPVATLIMTFFMAFAHLQITAQPQLELDPHVTSLQLYVVSMVKRSANDYYSCGILPNGSDFGMVTRFTSNQVLWNNSFGFISPCNVQAIVIARNDDVVISVANIGKGFVARIDQNGNLLWVTNISTGGEALTDIIEDANNDIYTIGAITSSQEFITKLSSSGTILWEKQPVSSLGIADYPQLLLSGDSVINADGPLGGDIAVRILNSSGVELFYRTYGVAGINEQLTSFIKVPGGYAIATRRTTGGAGRIGIIILDQSFNVTLSQSYSSAGGDLENGKLLYDSGFLYLSGDKTSSNLPRAFVAKINPATLGVLWNKVLSSANSIPSCEPFIDGTLRVPYMRYPSLNGSVRGVMLASIDPATGNFTGTPCESPPLFSLVPGPYTGLIQTDQSISTWSDLVLSSLPSYDYGSYPLLIEDCEPGLLPVELLYFSGEATEDQNVLLKWSTASENGSDHFIVERSLDCLVWDSIGSVAASGYSQSEVEYSLIDHNPEPHRINYYRLREIDVDGASEISTAISVDLRDQFGQFSLWPNPVARGDVLLIGSPDEVLVTDSRGSIVSRGRHEIHVDFSPGSYIVSVSSKLGSYYRTKLIVME
jgi:hypothetical protein